MDIEKNIRRILREVRIASKVVGGTKRLFSILDLKGTKEDMIFLTKSIMENEVKEKLKYCKYIIVPSRHHVTLYVYIPKPLPEHEGVWSYDQSVCYQAEVLIGRLLHNLGDGLIRGHSIYVYNTGDC